MSKAYYILPVHNKESLIENVLYGILDSHSKGEVPPTIICILDGCFDKTEEKVYGVREKCFFPEFFHILKADDVHEIQCLNMGLEYIRQNLSPMYEDLVFMVQDDVILDEPDIDKKFGELFDSRDDLGYISMRLGVSVYQANGELKEENYIESEFGHWNQLGWNFHKAVNHGEFVESEIAIRSPTCTQWKRYAEHGGFDIALAPCGYDCHDFSIRMNEAGLVNGVYGMKFRSDVDWGTMRTDKPSAYADIVGAIYERNRKYLVNKHRVYFGVNPNQESKLIEMQIGESEYESPKEIKFKHHH